MKKKRFVLIGSGWRAEFYIRIAKALPGLFELAGVMIRDAEKGRDFARRFDVPVVNTLEELLALGADYAVLSIARGHLAPVLEALFQKGVPVLCETPPAESVDELNALWENARRHSPKIQVAEQYFLQPLYAAWEKALCQGLLGEVQNINLSALHGYHGISIIRRYLGAGFQNCTLFGKRYHFSVIDTLGREGLIQNGSEHHYPRDRLSLEFEGGKVAFFDFSDPAQYHSLLRTRQLTVQGLRGEIDDLTIRYLTAEGYAVTQNLNRVDFGPYNNQEWSHYGLFLGERLLYSSPFFQARLNDDEIAVASCMLKMGDYLDTGAEFYPLREALQDTYLALEMERALQNPCNPITTCAQSWV